jgi:hypothetical protein
MSAGSEGDPTLARTWAAGERVELKLTESELARLLESMRQSVLEKMKGSMLACGRKSAAECAEEENVVEEQPDVRYQKTDEESASKTTNDGLHQTQATRRRPEKTVSASLCR